MRNSDGQSPYCSGYFPGMIALSIEKYITTKMDRRRELWIDFNSYTITRTFNWVSIKVQVMIEFASCDSLPVRGILNTFIFIKTIMSSMKEE